MMVSPQEALPLLERRETALTAILQGLEAGTAAARYLPRVLMLESEYLLVTATAQLHWIRSVIEDLRKGTLSWSEEELRSLADESVAQSGAVEPSV
jgi:hypothetical protein